MTLTLFSTSIELTSLRANSSDRFSDGLKHLYPDTGRPITRLRYLGQQDGLFWYAAADDAAATLPPTAGAPCTLGACRVLVPVKRVADGTVAISAGTTIAAPMTLP